ncbi:MAG: PQQ-dependent dehydrogenase, methanol/ethanol family [Paracoccus sp. (in: a-proteobacteria)]|uniref:PQQ-dependent dehydrogenase, methanol/ethanol family n=1 Tax=Paracoccus sp. TaxID=267 RepID=UPI0026E051B2|nr:PQQ-dependent dehydrogenase, methanol/ethanol family [Paracoccus sp. (in: a-proteobacteria)]MDO5621177.1 PQQ-dependent dehydrogenase, methanol/ethanol family [Paracoccus sp. (in: a-proteobacteria)]
MRQSYWAIAACAAAVAAGGASAQDTSNPVAGLTDTTIIANATETKNWPSYGLDYQETRFSKLDQINADNVGDLGLAWSLSLESRRGVEATPLIMDGVMYVSSSWSIVHAIDAVTGRELWRYDPKVPHDYAAKGCCDVVNRGVAVYDGKVYVGAFDGWLHAIDAATGQLVWKVDTIENRDMSYTITGAPRVYKGKVMIGNGGAEMGVRGYISAYDAASGDQVWRFYTVPGDPSKPFESKAMQDAAATWDAAGEWWKLGGGGTVWDSMAYDPDLDLMYIGVGNGSPWNAALRSPAGGDNLYLGSVVALRPDTGEYVCHYQETPAENWDYTSTQHIILSDIEWQGETRKVFMHAPKNGFFFVVDRTNCQFLSAEPFVKVTWASGYDDNGRPIENPQARSPDGAVWETIPSAFGAHNWHPMSYNPQTGLVYIPAQGVPGVQQPDPDWQPNQLVPEAPMSANGWNLGKLLSTGAPKATPYGQLLAWDPVKQAPAWRVDYVSPWNGGTLTTAGNLVFQGTADGRFVAYDAATGDMLWQSPVGTGVVAAPATWEKDGVQYVSIAVGWGGIYGLMNRATEVAGPGRVYTFRLGGDAPMPELKMRPTAHLVEGVPYDPADVEAGAKLYVASCLFCHGVPAVDNGGALPNLGYSAHDIIAALPELVLADTFTPLGMPSFQGKLSESDLHKIAAFIQNTADAVRGN